MISVIDMIQHDLFFFRFFPYDCPNVPNHEAGAGCPNVPINKAGAGPPERAKS